MNYVPEARDPRVPYTDEEQTVYGGIFNMLGPREGFLPLQVDQSD